VLAFKKRKEISEILNVPTVSLKTDRRLAAPARDDAAEEDPPPYFPPSGMDAVRLLIEA
jgi:hypothetical protein